MRTLLFLLFVCHVAVVATATSVLFHPCDDALDTPLAVSFAWAPVDISTSSLAYTICSSSYDLSRVRYAQLSVYSGAAAASPRIASRLVSICDTSIARMNECSAQISETGCLVGSGSLLLPVMHTHGMHSDVTVFTGGITTASNATRVCSMTPN